MGVFDWSPSASIIEKMGGPNSSLRAVVATPKRPAPAPKPAKIAPLPVAVIAERELAEYAAIAAEVGVAPPDMTIEQFKNFLAEKDIPVFRLAEVVAYMDAKAEAEARENGGWLWKPLRAKDRIANASFGRGASHVEGINRVTTPIFPASDLYRSNVGVYSLTVPLHALRKVALIEREFKHPIHFMVSDYAPKPEIVDPDPFLMAVIPNPRLADGVGRFVIDFWDEPGFGLTQMLKPA